MAASVSRARAGHYIVTYTGGTVVTTENGKATTVNYSGGGTSSYGGGGSCDCTSPHTSGSLVLSGQITATFTFVPNPSVPGDQAPPAVVIEQNCYAWASPYAYNASEITGESATSGLGFPQVGPSTGDVHSGGSGPGLGALYEIKQNPGNSFTVTCSPSLNITVARNASDTGPGVIMGGGVSYTAAANPLYISLDGGIGGQATRSYLIGQSCGGSLVMGGLTASPTPNYKWAVPAGGSPFKNWLLSNYVVNTGMGNKQVPETATYEPLQPADLNQAAVQCYFRQKTTSVIKLICSCDLAVPSGALPAAGFPGTSFQSLPFSVQAPSFLPGETASFTANKQGQYIDLTTASGTLGLNRIDFYGKVTTPAAFVTSNGDIGEWGLVQLWTPNRTATVNGNTVAIQNNGKQGLDNFMPYQNYWIPDGSQGDNYDAPFMNPPAGASTESDTDSFYDYMLYRPPGASTGGNSCWVPLYYLTWTWNATATYISGSGWYLNPGANKSNSPGGTYPAFPTWSFAWMNNTTGW